MRLNGWQRIGVVLSVIWFFVGGWWGNSIGIHMGDWTLNAYTFCLKYSDDIDRAKCGSTFNQQYAAAIADHWWIALVMATVPTIIVWLLVYGALAVFRWVRRGFAN